MFNGRKELLIRLGLIYLLALLLNVIFIEVFLLAFNDGDALLLGPLALLDGILQIKIVLLLLFSFGALWLRLDIITISDEESAV